MTRFWLSLSLALVALLFVWNSLFYFFPKGIFHYDNAIWKAKFDLLRAEKNASDVVILGDSDAISSLKATGTKRTTINLGLACGGPIEAEAVYEQYLRTHSAPKILVIQFAHYFYDGLECLPLYSLAYDFFSLKQKNEIMAAFDHVEPKPRLFGDKEHALDSIRMSYVSRRRLFLALLALHLTPQHIEYARTLLTPSEWPPYREDFRKAFIQRGHWVVGTAQSWPHLRTNHFIFDEFKPNPAIAAALERILMRAEEENIKVILNFAPYNEITVANFSETHRRQLAEFIAELKARHPSLLAQDYIPVLPDDCIGDEDLHTNARGAEVVSAALEEQLDEIDPR